MFALRLLVCFAAMPFLVEAELFGLWACGAFLNVLDRMGQTHAGAIQLTDFFQRNPAVMLWNPNERESDHECLTLSLKSDGMFQHRYLNTKGELVTHEGKMTYSTYPTTAFELTATNPEDGDPTTDMRLPLGILSANRDGVAKMFPLFISDSEVIMLNCLNTFFGHVMSVYVLTTQDLSSLNTECAISTVKEATGITVKSAGNMTKCMELNDAKVISKEQ